MKQPPARLHDPRNLTRVTVSAMNTETTLERVEKPVEETKIPPTLHLCCGYCKMLCCKPDRYAKDGCSYPHTTNESRDCVVCVEMWPDWFPTHKLTCEDYNKEDDGGDT